MNRFYLDAYDGRPNRKGTKKLHTVKVHARHFEDALRLAETLRDRGLWVCVSSLQTMVDTDQYQAACLPPRRQ